jgi:hypothetical protein
MNSDDKKYLKSAEKVSPNISIFSKMVEMLKDAHGKTNQLLTKANASLLKTFKNISD